MDPRHPPMVDGVLEVYQRYGVALLQAAIPRWIQLDITTIQLKCLMVLGARGVVSIGRISGVLGTTKSNASILIDQLVRRGLVVRTEDLQDRRVKKLSLTSEGRRFIQCLHQGDEEFIRDCLACLQRDDLIALQIGLAALTQVMSRAEG